MRRDRASGERGGCGAGPVVVGAARLLTATSLRTARPDDAAAIAAIYAPHVVTGVASFEAEAPDADAMRRRMAAGATYPWIVTADAGGEVVGYAYAAPFREREAYRWMAETTVYLAATAQRRGIGRQLYGALLRTLAAQGFTAAIGAIALPNGASVALHEALGFRATGLLRGAGYKHGRWIDVGYWQRTLATPTVPPADPRPFAEVGIRAD